MGIAVLGASTDSAFDVVVYGFDATHESPLDGLRRVFGLDEAAAEALLNAMPAIVCRRVNYVRAEYFCRALRSIGARIEVLDERGECVALAESAPSLRPLSAAVGRVGMPPMAAANHNGREPTLRYDQPSASRAPSGAALPSLVSQASLSRHGEAWGELIREPNRPPSQRASQANAAPESRAGTHRLDSETKRKLPAAPQPHRLDMGDSVGTAHAVADPAQYRALSLTTDDMALPALELETISTHVAANAERRVPAPAPVLALAGVDAHGDTASHVRRAPRHPQPSAAGVPAQARPAPRIAASAASESAASFWQELPTSLLLPWRDSGKAWFFSIGAWAVFANVLSVLGQAVPFVGTSFVLMVNMSVLALCADYHRHCMWSVINGEDSLAAGPDFDPARILHGYMRSGTHLTVFAMVSQLPLVFWLGNTLLEGTVLDLRDLLRSWPVWALGALPALYWPMGIATASLYNQFQGVWHVGLGLRAVLRAPREYLSVVAIGGVTLVVPWVVSWIICSALGVSSSFILTMAALPLAASHAVMGALTGQVIRSHPHLFES